MTTLGDEPCSPFNPLLSAAHVWEKIRQRSDVIFSPGSGEKQGTFNLTPSPEFAKGNAIRSAGSNEIMCLPSCLPAPKPPIFPENPGSSRKNFSFCETSGNVARTRRRQRAQTRLPSFEAFVEKIRNATKRNSRGYPRRPKRGTNLYFHGTKLSSPRSPGRGRACFYRLIVRKPKETVISRRFAAPINWRIFMVLIFSYVAGFRTSVEPGSLFRDFEVI